MSLISDLRTYIDTRVKLVDPNLDADQLQVFGDDNPAKHLANKRYNLILGAMANERDDSNHIETLEFQIDIYVKPKQKTIEAFDDLYDKARCIRDEIIHFESIRQNTDFFDITAENITPIPEETNDKAFRMQLSFIVTRKYRLS